MNATPALYRPHCTCTYNKGAYVSGTKVFNHLPQYIKASTNDHKYFKYTILISSFFLLNE